MAHINSLRFIIQQVFFPLSLGFALMLDWGLINIGLLCIRNTIIIIFCSAFLDQGTMIVDFLTSWLGRVHSRKREYKRDGGAL